MEWNDMGMVAKFQMVTTQNWLNSIEWASPRVFQGALSPPNNWKLFHSNVGRICFTWGSD